MKIFEVNRTFYIICLILMLLMAIMAIVGLIYYLQFGDALYTLGGFKFWYAFGAVLTVVDGLFFARYVRFKNFQMTFYTVMISVAVSTFHFYVVYMILSSGTLQEYFATTYLLMMGFSLPYAASLAFSNANLRPYLKLSGILILILNSLIFLLFIMSTRTADIQFATQLRTLQAWLGFGGNLFLVLFIMNYLDEIKKIGEDKVSNADQDLNLSQG